MADRKISDLTALTAPAAGDFLPIVDISESLVANKNKRITIEELLRGAPDGTAAAPSIAFESDGGNGFYLAGTDSIGASTNGVNRLTLSTTAFTSTLPFVAPLGAAATPSLAFTGDTNTGIYSPGADQVAISTNGTGRLFVDASGNVRVTYAGTPLGRLHVRGELNSRVLHLDDASADDGHRFFAVTSSSNGLTWDINVKGASNSVGGTLTFSTNNTERSRIRADGTFEIKGGGTAGSSPAVSVNPSAPANSAVIDSSGRLGLGTSSPQVLLHGTTSVSAATEYAGVGFLENSLNNVDTGATVAYPVLKLTRAGKSGVSFRSSAQFGIARYEAVGTAARTRLDIALGHGDVAQPDTTVMSLLSSGAVGIGTTPVVNLDVAPAASTATFRIHARSNTTPVASIELVRGTNTTFGGDGSGDYRIKNDTGNLSFEYGDTGVTTERARIDSSGRLLVGTSTNFGDAATVQSIGTNPYTFQGFRFGGDNGLISLGSAGGTQASPSILTAGNLNLGGFVFRSYDSAAYRIGAQITAVAESEWASGDCPTRLVFSVTADGSASPTEALRISNNRSITVSDGGNVVLGTTTGTKIGTATTQKLGFFNKTPVVQPTAVADATDAASVITQLNALLSRMRDLGLIAT